MRIPILVIMTFVQLEDSLISISQTFWLWEIRVWLLKPHVRSDFRDFGVDALCFNGA